MRISKLRLTIVFAALVLAAGANRNTAGQSTRRSESGRTRPDVCSNHELIKAIQIIDQACDEISCDFATLRQLDRQIEKGALLAAFRNPDLQSIHIFFPMNEADVKRSFDWNTGKRDQLATAKYMNDPDNSIVYVLGRASAVGDLDVNVRLSRERMRSVMKYLKNDLGVRCHAFHGGWFGREIQQLSLSDARMLNIEPRDFRDDPLILNQSVHLFIFPCADKLF